MESFGICKTVELRRYHREEKISEIVHTDC